jgi:hypothetical protein
LGAREAMRYKIFKGFKKRKGKGTNKKRKGKAQTGREKKNQDLISHGLPGPQKRDKSIYRCAPWPPR